MKIRSGIVFAGAAVLALTCVLRADFNSKDVQKAGFAAKDGEFDGMKLTDAQKAKVQAAIDKIKMMGSDADKACACKLAEMLKNGRICAEGGTSTSTTTLPDGMTGSAGDGINIPPGRIDDPDKLVGTLCHEWVHVMQTGPYPEGPAYAAGKKWLQAIGLKETDPYLIWYCCQTMIANCDPSKKKVATGGSTALSITPQYGEKTIELAGGASTFAVHEGSSSLMSFNRLSPAMTATLLAMAAPLNMYVVPGMLGPSGGTVLVISGVALDGSGVLQYVEVDDENAVVLQTLATATLPVSDPLDLCFNGSAESLWVLDTANRRVLLVNDSNGDGLADRANARPFATRAQFPALAGALSIQTNLDAPASVIVANRDHRGDGTIDLDESVAALYDTNADGVANATISYVRKEGLFVVPGPSPTPVLGDSSVSIFAETGATVELWRSDASSAKVQFLGSTTLGALANFGTITTSTEFQAGDWLLLDDEQPSVPFTPTAFQVAPAVIYGSQDGGGVPVPTATWVGSGSLGTGFGTLVSDAPRLSPAKLLAGLSPLSFPLDAAGAPGWVLLVSPQTAMTATTDIDGAAWVDFTIPNEPQLVGMQVHLQWMVAAPAANPLGEVFSKGIVLTIGP
jgi:hypothetical protein